MIKLFKPLPATNVTVSRVATSTTSGQLLAANAARVGWRVHNEAAVVLYVLFGTGTASATNYSVSVAAASSYECSIPFAGAVQGVLASGAGSTAQITEAVP